jgi:hypothetical protein
MEGRNHDTHINTNGKGKIQIPLTAAGGIATEECLPQ